MAGLLTAMREQNPELAEQYARHYTAPNHYQDYLREILLGERNDGGGSPRIVVETGVSYGISSDRILATLDEIGIQERGLLYSVDPNPPAGVFEVSHPRWSKLKQLSTEALPFIYEHTGPWDIFLHDSDHEVWCQTFEYEVAWHFVRGGGLIMSDDTTWGSPIHGAWERFCKRYNLTPRNYGHCGVVRKPAATPGSPTTRMDHEFIRSVIDGATALADRALAEYKTHRTEIQPNLFVGTREAATALGADVPADWCCISVTEYRAKYGRGEELPNEPNGAMEFPFMLSGTADNTMLDRMAKVIHAQLAAGKKVLVHCVQAHERSPLAIAWYLAWTGERTMEDAYALVRSRHVETEDRMRWIGSLRPIRS